MTAGFLSHLKVLPFSFFENVFFKKKKPYLKPKDSPTLLEQDNEAEE